jgi:protease II
VPGAPTAAWARILDLAAHLRELDGLRPPPVHRGDAGAGDRHEEVRLLGPDERELTTVVRLRPGHSATRSVDGSAVAVVGDRGGDERHAIRVWAATTAGVELVHSESPVSPQVRAVGTGLLWVRRDAARRPHAAIWWDRERARPIVVLEEADRTRRLEIRSVERGLAVLASRGARSTRHWTLVHGAAGEPACRALSAPSDDVDVIAFGGGVVVLDRQAQRVQGHDVAGVDLHVPDGFVAQTLQPVAGSFVVVGRHDGRQAFWAPAQGAEAVWTAPPAGTMIPAADQDSGRLAFLVSSPVHQPQVVRPDDVGDVKASSTGRADPRCLTADSDGARIPVTLLRPPGATPAPVVVHVYGAYGLSLEGPFDPFTDDLLARGVAIAYCHVRGGGEFGPRWHRQATGADRARSIDDLVACLAALRELPGIDADRIVVSAASAGALTAVMACLREPSWTRGLHLVHPFVDPLGALLDARSPLATTDWAELGDPRDDPVVRRRIEGFSPLARLRGLAAGACPLPRTWIRSARQDARVDASVVEEFSRRYREASSSLDPLHVVLRTTDGGHLGGPSPDVAHAENLLAHAWLIDVLDAPWTRDG